MGNCRDVGRGSDFGGEGTEARDEAKQSVAGVSESESSRGSDYR